MGLQLVIACAPLALHADSTRGAAWGPEAVAAPAVVGLAGGFCGMYAVIGRALRYDFGRCRCMSNASRGGATLRDTIEVLSQQNSCRRCSTPRYDRREAAVRISCCALA